MNDFERELKKIFAETDGKKTFVGGACYADLGGGLTAKMEFFTGAVADEFTGLQASILNRAEGTIDSVKFRFSDLLGKKYVQNCNMKDGIYPFMWRNNHKVEWYAYQPDAGDYAVIRDAVSRYLDIFKEPLSMTPCHKASKPEQKKNLFR